MVFTNRLFTCGLPRLAYKVPRTTEDMPSRHQVQRGPEHTVWTPFTVLCRKRQLLSPPIIDYHYRLHRRVKAYCEQGSDAFWLNPAEVASAE